MLRSKLKGYLTLPMQACKSARLGPMRLGRVPPIHYNRGAGKIPDRLKFGAARLRKPMTSSVRQFIIHGTTQEGGRFRPSDWAERLAGVLSPFRPPESPGGHLTYSPYAMPVLLNGETCVSVDYRLRNLEPLAWKFAVDFAQSNRLRTTEREIEEPPPDVAVP
jgi:hypothetical protein